MGTLDPRNVLKSWIEVLTSPFPVISVSKVSSIKQCVKISFGVSDETSKPPDFEK